MGSAKLATIEDIPSLLRMGESFFNASGYSSFSVFDKDSVKQMFLNLIDADCLIVCDGGMLGFVEFPLFFDPNAKVMQELFWWVDEDKRGTGAALDMLNMAEKLANERGCKACIMLNISSLDGGRVSRLYTKLGYNSSENSFIKVL